MKDVIIGALDASIVTDDSMKDEDHFIVCSVCPENLNTTPKCEARECMDCDGVEGVILNVSQLSDDRGSGAMASPPRVSRAGELIKINALIENNPVEVMIDSGAEVNVIYSSVHDLLIEKGVEIRKNRKHVRVRGATGETQRAAFMVTIEITKMQDEDSWTIPLECVVLECPAHLQCADIILGRPTQRALGMVIHADDSITIVSASGGVQTIHEREGKEVPTLPSVARSIRNFLQISQEHHETNEPTARIIEVETNMGYFTPAKATAEEDRDDIAYAREQLDLIAEWEKPETKEIILRILDRLPGIATKAVKLARRRESGERKGLRELPHAVITLKPNAKLPKHQAQRLNSTMMKNLENKT